MKLGIYGYGNIGKGVELACSQNKDVELVGIFTRRDKNEVKSILGTKVYNVNELQDFKNKIDILAICGGSATELPKMTVELAKDFNVIDTFDTHANIPEHFKNVDKAAKDSGHIAMISCGWDPGMFSLNRLYANALLPNGKDYTFWGKGVSQGHSDAIRRIDGVKYGIQYTVPKQSALDKVKNGEMPELSTADKHERVCYVVALPDADKNRIEREIKEMPNYFKDYNTTVNFISEEEFLKNHNTLPHGGSVFRTGHTSDNVMHRLELSIKLDSNPEFTGSVVTAFVRATYKLYKEGKCGAITIFDIPPKYLSAKTEDELRKSFL